MPKVSVITPIYQTEEYLAKCFQSLTNQTLSDIELIWIDNGANEACKKLIAEHKTAAVKLIVLPENIGYMGAINAGLDAATGDYVGFCDSDDWVDTDYYENLYKTVVSQEADIVYCGYQYEYEKKSVKEPLRTLTLQNCRGAVLEALPAGSIWNALFKRTFIKEHNIINSSKSIYSDNTFSIPACLLAQKCALDKASYYHYRQRDVSTIHGTTKKERLQATTEVISDIFSNFPLQGFSEQEMKIFVDFLFRSLPIHIIKKMPKEAKAIEKSIYFRKKLQNAHAFHNPSFFQRLFSVSYCLNKPLVKVRFLGISIKFKLKQRRC